ncbi:MAG: M81 family metallopeptidase [Bryobacterales bacterium]|nr:M81 family metallopeptidase [Bryobacterales bacterium]MEB2362092.1 M81 family metallopeptidase [Bryobacterales bacterium]
MPRRTWVAFVPNFGTPLLVALLCSACLYGQEQRPVVGVAGISHESASFNPAKTRLEDFGDRASGRELEFLKEAELANTTVSGYVAGAKQYGLDLRPLVVAGASPKGPVTDDAFNTLAERILTGLKKMPKLDGVLLALHGAMVVESYPSGDLELVRRVRQTVGAKLPVIVTHDFHANVDPEISNYCDVLITYKENPHIDPKERGVQAAKIMAGMISGKVKPVQAIVKPPMMYNIVFQHTRTPPLKPIVDESRRLEQNPKILAVSVSGGYQYADVPQMGPSVIVVTDNDKDLAQTEAKRLSDMLWATRDQIRLNLPDAAQAVRQAMASDKAPVVLIDMGDNIGGGSSGDSTFLLEELLKQKAQGWVMVIADREAVKTAFEAGIGKTVEMNVGGKTDNLHGRPVLVRGRVKSMHEGKYTETEIRHGGGRYYNMGHTAVIEVEGSTRELPNLLLVTTARSSPNSLHQLISNGVYPTRQKIIVVKGAIAPRAAYEPIAGLMLGVDTPGVTAVNPARFPYKHVRRPLFGLD